MSNKKLLIKGWRGINHSFAMVNQHQIVALLNNHPEIDLYHRDIKFFMDHWSPMDNDAGFSVEDKAKIEALKDIDESLVDVTFQIHNPLSEPALARKKTISYVITEMGLNPNKFTTKEVVAKSAFTQGENIIVTATKWSKDRIVEYGFDESRIKILPHGVDTNYFFPLLEDARIASRKNIGIPDDCIVFLNIGIPTWNKGTDIALEAFAEINKKYLNTRFIIKDSSDLYGLTVQQVVNNLAQRRPELITQSFLTSLVVIQKNISQASMRNLYNTADYYLSPYRAEGFNLPVLEAMACGTPVIVSSYGATDDFCPSGMDGSVVKIPTIFNRGDIGERKNVAWVESDLNALIAIMEKLILSGGKFASGFGDIERGLVDHAKGHGWDMAVMKMAGML